MLRALATECDARRAFSLIELLTVLGLLAILLSITLPAVQRARAAARRLQCSNHLRELGLALNNYHENHRCFPTAGPFTAKFGPYAGEGYVYSPFVALLPYIGQAALFNAVNFVTGPHITGVSLHLNRTVVQTRLELYLCPADPSVSLRRFAPVSYRANVGARCIPAYHPDVGAFEPWKWLRAADILDGLATTAGLSEKNVGDLDIARPNPATQWQYEVAAPFPQTELLPEEAANICARADPMQHHLRADGGRSWFRNGYLDTWYCHAAAPNPAYVDCAFIHPIHDDIWIGVFAARSYHPGGVNVLMMDGSVRFVKDQVAPTVWKALGTRGGGEQVGDTSF